MATAKRLTKELKELRQKYSQTCSSADLVDNNIHKWKVTLIGPPDSPYEEGRFELSLTFPNDYPFKPPQIRFITQIFHPNISSEGKICLDILNTKWSAAYTVPKILVSLRSLICDPNANSPLNGEAGTLYRNNLEAYNRKVREMTGLYARPKKETVQNSLARTTSAPSTQNQTGCVRTSQNTATNLVPNVQNGAESDENNVQTDVQAGTTVATNQNAGLTPIEAPPPVNSPQRPASDTELIRQPPLAQGQPPRNGCAIS